jgi:hypothetical protein
LQGAGRLPTSKGNEREPRRPGWEE